MLPSRGTSRSHRSVRRSAAIPVSMIATFAGVPGPEPGWNEPGDGAGSGPPIALPTGAVGVMLLTAAVNPRVRRTLATSDSCRGSILSWVSRRTRPWSSAQSTSLAVISSASMYSLAFRNGPWRAAAPDRPSYDSAVIRSSPRTNRVSKPTATGRTSNWVISLSGVRPARCPRCRCGGRRPRSGVGGSRRCCSSLSSSCRTAGS